MRKSSTYAPELISSHRETHSTTASVSMANPVFETLCPKGAHAKRPTCPSTHIASIDLSQSPVQSPGPQPARMKRERLYPVPSWFVTHLATICARPVHPPNRTR